MDLLSPNCIFDGWGFQADFYVQTSIPFVLAIFIFYVRGPAIRNVLKRQRRDLKADMLRAYPENRAPETGGLTAFLTKWFGAPTLKGVTQDELEDASASVIRRGKAVMLSTVGAIYLTNSRYALQGWRCLQRADDKTVLNSDPLIECWSLEHVPMLVLGTLTAIFISIGLPVFAMYKLWTCKQMSTFTNPANLMVYGALYNPYEARAWWYQHLCLLLRFCHHCRFHQSGLPQAGTSLFLIAGMSSLKSFPEGYLP